MLVEMFTNECVANPGPPQKTTTNNSKLVHVDGEFRSYLVDGFNPSEKYQSNWIISSGRGEKKHV